MKYLTVIMVMLFALALVSCGGAPKTGAELAEDTIEEAPDWYNEPPSDPNYLYSATTEVSKDMQLSVDKAKQQGMFALTEQLEAKVEGMAKKFNEETGVGEDSEVLAQFEQVSKTVVSTTLNGARIDKQEIMAEGSLFRAYVLMELPWGEARADMLSRIKANDHLYTRFRASEAFKELEEEVAKYEEYKKEQGF